MDEGPVVIILRPVTLAVVATLAWALATAITAAWARVSLGRAIVRLITVITLTGGFGTLAVYLRWPAGQLALATVAACGGIWLAWSMYQHESGAASRFTLLCAAVLRCTAWLVLLAMIARPAFLRVVVEWEKPVLAVLLDQSDSMNIVDNADLTAQSRAARVNSAVHSLRPTIERIESQYEVRLMSVGARPTPIDNWHVQPTDNLTAIAAGLREAAELRSRRGNPPAAIMLVSDGAETAEDRTDVLAATEQLSSQRCPLYTISVGPRPGESPLVELGPLAVPPRAGLRDWLRVPVVARVQGCRGRALVVELLWDGVLEARTELRINYDIENIDHLFEVLPPGPGAHRLTARVILPEELGGGGPSVSKIVEFGDERIRVLIIAGVPNTESAFAARALRGDESIDLVEHYAFGADTSPTDRNALAERLDGADVIIVSSIDSIMDDATTRAVLDAVTKRAAGLLLVASSDELASIRPPLAAISPLETADAPARIAPELRLRATPLGKAHPILEALGRAEDDAPTPLPNNLWDDLPPVPGPFAVPASKPAAAILLVDENSVPRLIAHEVGAGRCVLIALDAIWPWALASDLGLRTHDQLWRQMVVWLANRRPHLWVVTDRSEYTLAGLASGDRRVQIRVGISGLPPDDADAWRNALVPTATLAPDATTTTAGRPVDLALKRKDDEWAVDWPVNAEGLSSGRHVVSVTAQIPPDHPLAKRHDGSEMSARTTFSVVAQNVERLVPTANSPLMRTMASQTAPWGGREGRLADLGPILKTLADDDRRERIERPVQYDLARESPWTMLMLVIGLLGLEWALRKRAGLS